VFAEFCFKGISMSVKIRANSINGSQWRIGGFLGAVFAVMVIFCIVPIFEKNF
jgi:hypothetical protein